MTKPTQADHTAAFSQAFYIANLLFVGVFYIALWALYFLKYDKTTLIGKHHLKQALLAATISTSIFLVINIFIILGAGYASLQALLSLELYFMLVVPGFLMVGILAFIKAVRNTDYTYPLIGRLIKNPAD